MKSIMIPHVEVYAYWCLQSFTLDVPEVILKSDHDHVFGFSHVLFMAYGAGYGINQVAASATDIAHGWVNFAGSVACDFATFVHFATVVAFARSFASSGQLVADSGFEFIFCWVSQSGFY